jgi:hypothetical protein
MVQQAELGIAIQFCLCNRTYQEWVIGFADLHSHLGTIKTLRIATISFVMSVRTIGTTRLPLHGFS